MSRGRVGRAARVLRDATAASATWVKVRASLTARLLEGAPISPAE